MPGILILVAPPMQSPTKIDCACASADAGIDMANTAKNAAKGLIRRSVITRPIIVDQDPQGGTVHIIKLA